jgi:hypothetical protein
MAILSSSLLSGAVIEDSYPLLILLLIVGVFSTKVTRYTTRYNRFTRYINRYNVNSPSIDVTILDRGRRTVVVAVSVVLDRRTVLDRGRRTIRYILSTWYAARNNIVHSPSIEVTEYSYPLLLLISQDAETLNNSIKNNKVVAVAGAVVDKWNGTVLD